MYEILIKLIVGVSLIQLGINAADINKCPSRQCLAQIQSASHKVLKIDWKPISVFPEEARRFR